MAGIQKGKAVPDWWAFRKAALSLVGWYLGAWYVADCLVFRRMVLSLIGWLSETLCTGWRLLIIEVQFQYCPDG